MPSTRTTPSSSGGVDATPGSDDLKLGVVSRLLLDNIQHVKAYWIMMGLLLAQVALHFGADDVQGTVVREEIFHAAGARTETEQKIEELVRVSRRPAASLSSGTRSTTRCDGIGPSSSRQVSIIPARDVETSAAWYRDRPG